MNILYHILLASAVLASRRQLWWQNEARFILGPARDGRFNEPNKALGVPYPHNWGDRVVLMDRNDDDRYQKIRLQDTEEGLYIRFDNHPQPGIRTRDDNNEIEMYNAAWDNHGEWALVINYIWDKDRNRWVEPALKIQWTAREVKHIGRMRVAVYNKGKDAFLRVKNGQPEMMRIDLDNEEDAQNLHNAAWVKEQQLEWELVYVTNAWGAGAVTLLVVGPIAVATLVVAAYVSPALATASFATYGFYTVPTMQFLGAAAIAQGTAKWITVTMVAAIVAKHTTIYDAESETSVGGIAFDHAMKMQDEMEPLETYSVTNPGNFAMEYGTYGFALVGLMAIAMGVYRWTCGKAKMYDEIQRTFHEEA